jgi:hypothetical protein
MRVFSVTSRAELPELPLPRMQNRIAMTGVSNGRVSIRQSFSGANRRESANLGEKSNPSVADTIVTWRRLTEWGFVLLLTLHAG